jgi:hypothetical protein
MAQPVEIELHRGHFGEAERVVARSGAITVSSFRYATGVEALRVENGAGHIVCLPFQGQQIWDAHFLGRRLTMRSMFDEPRPTRDYLETYGAFFIHCGGLSMGNPGPDDRHPLHGELPNLPYDSAALAFGEDASGRYVELSGVADVARAFNHHFVARPRLRLRENATEVEAAIVVENRAVRPLAFLYLAHVNFLPADGATLHDAGPDDGPEIAIRKPKLAADTRAAVRVYHEAVAAQPSAHRTIAAGVPVEPELVLTMRLPAGPDGWTHALQRRPDGSADFVSYRPDELPFAVRWMTRDGDQDALGIVLPATAPPDGLAAARSNGQLVMVPPGGRFAATMRFGALEAAEAAVLSARIDAIRSGAG